MSGPQELGYTEVAVATALVVLTGGVSLALKLGLERRLLWAALRTVVRSYTEEAGVRMLRRKTQVRSVP